MNAGSGWGNRQPDGESELGCDRAEPNHAQYDTVLVSR